jgi:hypothetical protein
MNALDPTPRAAISYRCTSCSRCFVALDEEVAGQILCACGAPLSAGPLPRGVYELRSSVSVDARATNPGHAPIPKEPDIGYGASHGYDATHGGPTGPGDAPARVEGTLP